jgi:hypothetical protein
VGARIAGVLLTVALAAGLSGCVVFKGPIRAHQVGDKPRVAVTFKLCNSSDEPDTPCPNLGNSNDAGNPNGILAAERVLLGFRVPKGARTPARIHPANLETDSAFTRFALYTHILNKRAPGGPAYEWVGYQGNPQDTTPTGGGDDTQRFDKANFRVVLGLPKGFEGHRFKFRPVVGWWDGQEALACGPNIFEPVYDEDGLVHICIDSPSPKAAHKSIAVPIG